MLNPQLNFFGLSNLTRLYDFKNKEQSLQYYISYMLMRTSRMFEYEGLPETIPHRYLELYLQLNGHVAIAEHDGNLYAFFGGFGGEPNVYYMPQQYIVANPYLKLNKIYNIGENCVIVPNDTMYLGLLPMFRRYATALVENDLTMRVYDINARITALIDAQDDNTKDSALRYLENVENGDMGVISSSAFFDGIRAQPYYAAGQKGITELIEYQQYLKASWFNEVGLNANYNMKRESLNSAETTADDDMLLPLIDDMLENRQKYFDKVNEMFGTSISVRLASSWEIEREEMEGVISEYSEIEETDEIDETEEIEETDETEEITEALGEITDVLENIVGAIEGGENENEDVEETRKD